MRRRSLPRRGLENAKVGGCSAREKLRMSRRSSLADRAGALSTAGFPSRNRRAATRCRVMTWRCFKSGRRKLGCIFRETVTACHPDEALAKAQPAMRLKRSGGRDPVRDRLTKSSQEKLIILAKPLGMIWRSEGNLRGEARRRVRALAWTLKRSDCRFHHLFKA